MQDKRENNYGKYQQNNKNGKYQTKTIVADFYNPYAFVPLSNVVYQLTESETKELDKIQDAPIENGYSGKIYIDFESMTPFCVRCQDKGNMHIGDKYFVPGSSVKGMLRGVMEILSMANTRNGVANNRYSMRDLHSDKYELKQNNPSQRSGFLVKIKGNYYIQPCDSQPYSYKEILNWESVFKEKGEKLKKILTEGRIDEKYKALKNRYVIFDGDNGETFTSVFLFSGSMRNKKKEYLFDVPDKFDNLIPIHDKQWKEFIYIHTEENENKSWKYWRELITDYPSPEAIENDKTPRIAPCFFRTMDDGASVKDLGFAFLYRQPYDKSIHDFFPKAYHVNGIDLCDAVFGYVRQKLALKGRVMVGHSFIDNPKVCSKQTFVLNSPKPSFYPFYLDQSNRGKDLNTYFSNTTISGTKRYLVQSKEQESQPGTQNVDTQFFPLDKGTKFTSVLYFHNLHDYELGALLSAITFFRHSECFHSLGYAKPFGFGKMKINSHKIEFADREIDEEKLYASFINKICDTCNISENEWLTKVSPLFAIAAGVSSKVRYPNMKEKEFNAIKNQNYSINDFSPLGKNNK